MNDSAANAFAIASIPSITAASGSGVPDGTDERWWYFDAQAGDFFVGIKATPGGTGWSDAMRLRVYTGTPGSLVDTGIQALDATPIAVPVLAGSRYYLKFTDRGITPNVDATLSIDLVYPPSDAAPVGSIIVTDENPPAAGAPFPAIVIDATTGAVLAAIPYAASERGWLLQDGTTLLRDVDTSDLLLYDPTGTLVTTITGFTSEGAISSDREAFFYVADGGVSNTVRKFDATGTQVASWTLPNTGVGAGSAIRSIVPFRDGSTLLYARATPGSPVQAYNLNTSSALADFASAPTASHTSLKETLVLADGTVVIGWEKGSVTRNFVVTHYTAAGATIESFDMTQSQGAGYRISINGADDSDSIWVRQFPGANQSQFTQIALNGGSLSILRSLTVDEFNGGNGASGTTARFGPSNSCPFWPSTTAALTRTVRDKSVPCCCDCPPPPTTSRTPVSKTTNPGPILDTVEPETWDRLCSGNGMVPTAVDATDPESWAYQ